MERPRFAIDDFERLLIKVFSEFGTLDAIWVREVPNKSGEKLAMRMVWLQFARISPGEMTRAQQLVSEMTVRYLPAPFALEFRCLIDDVPPAVIASACIYRRGERPKEFK